MRPDARDETNIEQGILNIEHRSEIQRFKDSRKPKRLVEILESIESIES
jgi:hypothetical protein